MKLFKKEHGFSFNDKKVYTQTMADERDVICNTKFLKNIKPKVNKEKYKQVFRNYALH